MFGWQLQTVPMQRAADLDVALRSIAEGGADALYSVGDPVILQGGEVGIRRTWWNSPQRDEWRWTLEFYNHT